MADTMPPLSSRPSPCPARLIEVGASTERSALAMPKRGSTDNLQKVVKIQRFVCFQLDGHYLPGVHVISQALFDSFKAAGG
jgi:hypothetical protein